MPVTIDGTNGITTPTYGGTDTSEYLVPVTAFKNRIINGAMQIDQRNAGASVTPSSTIPAFPVDRFDTYQNQASKWTIQQNQGSVTPPSGFRNYVGITSSSSYSIGAGDIFVFEHKIEGNNTADLMWGTANAKTVTISFWVQSSLTGTFGLDVRNNDSSYNYLTTYTINAANTWEYKTVTIAGSTAGTWQTTTSTGIGIIWNLGTGTTYQNATTNTWLNGDFVTPTGCVSLVGTSGATWRITGVQFEVGSTATSFDYRPYGTELALCQRYYEKYSSTAGTPIGYMSVRTGAWYGWIPFRAEKRAAPTITLTGSFFLAGTAGDIASQTPTDINEISVYGCRPYKNSGSYTAQGAYIGFQTPSTNSLAISAEL